MRRLGPLVVAAVLATSVSARAEVRVISGSGLPVLPHGEQPPQRIEPPTKPAAPPSPIVTRRFAPVVIEDAATLSIGQLRLIQLGVTPLEPDETCRDPAGVEWGCGRRLLAALRGYVRMRPLDCDVPKDAKRGRFEAECRIGGITFGEQAVRRGWARATPGGPFEAAEAEARREGLGIFGPAPAATPAPPFEPPVGTGVPADTTMAPLGADGTRVTPETTAAPAPGAPMPLGR